LATHVPLALHATVYDHYEQHQIKVKFRDLSRVRLLDGQPVDIDNAVGAAAIDAVQQAALGGEWRRSQTVAEATLDQLRAEAMANSGRQLPDLNNYLRLQLAPGDDALAAIARFEILPIVERALLIEKPLPPPADVPDYTKAGAITGNVATDRYQRYLDAAPDGIDARYAWLGNNGTGSGVKICDVEYNVNFNHSDINPITLLGPTPDPTQDDNHGTAVMGVVGGKNDGSGVKGIAHGATLYFASADTAQNGYDVAAAIQQCMTVLKPGDVIILEQQIRGPNFVNGQSGCFGCVPVEWNKENYDTIVTAVAKDLVVVEAGANGSQDLDSSDYQSGNGGHYPFQPANDSGALIVGGGRSPYGDWGSPARSAASYSNYGATVDLQGWGGGVVTSGYGDFFPGANPPDTDDKNLWYRRSFAGTSSASPVVAGAVALLQSVYKAENGTAATPAQIKQILRDTGTPQVGTKQIGPLPDLRAAILSVLGSNVLTVPPPVITPGNGTYAMPLQVTIAYGSNMPAGNRNLRYTLDGSEPTADSFLFMPEQGDSLYLNYAVTLKAKAFVSDPQTRRLYESETATAIYLSATPKVATPTL
ncbi:MAG: S8 family serine peptidase, partial [Caldilineaceae bacterium]|nr:S8 family serine peptidase [Caldilineaceae bacterium]